MKLVNLSIAMSPASILDTWYMLLVITHESHSFLRMAFWAKVITSELKRSKTAQNDLQNWGNNFADMTHDYFWQIFCNFFEIQNLINLMNFIRFEGSIQPQFKAIHHKDHTTKSHHLRSSLSPRCCVY